MEEQEPISTYESEYIRVPKLFTFQGEKVSKYIELRKPHGTHLKKINGRELIAPIYTDLPIESGYQLQLLNSTITNQHLGESPLISEKVPPLKIIDLARMGIIVEEFLIEKTDTAWVNFNFHTRPPLNPYALEDAQYNPLTLDIHGRDINDERNWTRPPATHGAWGLTQTEYYEDEARRDLQYMTDHKTDISELRQIEEKQRILFSPDIIPHPSNPLDFEGWQNHPSGYYFEEGRHSYSKSEKSKFEKIYKSDEFNKKVKEIDSLSLFSENPVINSNFHNSEIFPPNDTDMVLIECSFGDRSYQVVTQKVPLVDRQDGIHMVVKLRPEPHTPWENQSQTLEALAIGLYLARIFQKHKLLKDDKSDGEIGDAYFDMNANWSMTKKREFIKNMPLGEVKKIIQKDTRAHLHVQLEKIDARWEIPPAPGTFNTHKPQTQETINKIREVLSDDKEGMVKWLKTNFTK